MKPQKTRKTITISQRRSRLNEREWQNLLEYGRRKARAAEIQTEEDVERLIDQSRKTTP